MFWHGLPVRLFASVIVSGSMFPVRLFPVERYGIDCQCDCSSVIVPVRLFPVKRYGIAYQCDCSSSIVLANRLRFSLMIACFQFYVFVMLAYLIVSSSIVSSAIVSGRMFRHCLTA